MPAPGEQHLNSGVRTITNPFDDKKPRVSEYTAQEIATLQLRLAKQLGPEYLSSRAGPGGGKVHYVTAYKCIQLANEVFGFNGWSSQIMDIQVDFVDENPTTLKVTLGLSVIVRVTLRDGTFHEDIGYGHTENAKGKAAAFEKAKKQGTTDGMKRALKNFGNVLGNCIYDKEYLAKVARVKNLPGKWDPANLYRHEDHIVKEELQVPRFEEKSQSVGSRASAPTEDTLEDEFGDFDEADFGVPDIDEDGHPDEVVLPAPAPAFHHHGSSGIKIGNTSNEPPVNQNRPPVNLQQPHPPPGNTIGVEPLQPQTPNGGFNRATNGVASGAGFIRLPQEPALQRPAQPAPVTRVLNQPSRNGLPSAPHSPARQPVLSAPDDPGLPPPGLGFFSAKAATREPEGYINELLPPHTANLPVFNLHAESPSIRRTVGVDHKSSKPLNRELRHVAPGSSQAVAAGPSAMRANVVNPQLDATRRIGVPSGGSPMTNRGSYKPPTIKRSIDAGGVVAGNRPPLLDLPTNGAVSSVDGGDVKRQRING